MMVRKEKGKRERSKINLEEGLDCAVAREISVHRHGQFHQQKLFYPLPISTISFVSIVLPTLPSYRKPSLYSIPHNCISRVVESNLCAEFIPKFLSKSTIHHHSQVFLRNFLWNARSEGKYGMKKGRTKRLLDSDITGYIILLLLAISVELQEDER